MHACNLKCDLRQIVIHTIYLCFISTLNPNETKSTLFANIYVQVNRYPTITFAIALVKCVGYHMHSNDGVQLLVPHHEMTLPSPNPHMTLIYDTMIYSTIHRQLCHNVIADKIIWRNNCFHLFSQIRTNARTRL